MLLRDAHAPVNYITIFLNREFKCQTLPSFFRPANITAGLK